MRLCLAWNTRCCERPGDDVINAVVAGVASKSPSATQAVACGTCPFALEWLPKVGDFVANKFAFSLLYVSEMASNHI